MTTWDSLVSASKTRQIKQIELNLNVSSEPTTKPQICIELRNSQFVLFVPEALENRARLIAGLKKLNWVSGNDPQFGFSKRKIERIIYLTSNYSVRWGISQNMLKGD